MSGIFGIFHRDGRPAALETLAEMQSAMAYWGRDGSGALCEGEVGLGQLMLHNTPESLHESLPRKSPTDGLVLTAGARIDNRDELLRLLEIPLGERLGMTDSALILRAFRKWGTGCPDRLLGDWAFAIWDPRRRRLFLARDHHGNTGLYYTSNPRFFAFSSCLKGLLALPGVPRRLRALGVAQVLVGWQEHGAPTCYEEILRLPPAHALTVTRERIEAERYWHLENTPELRLASDEEYLEAFLELYAEAVRCRLRSHRSVAVTLSGGLDSGSVAALAARELGKEDRRLNALSSVPVFDVSGLDFPGLVDETPLIEATRRYVGNLDVTYVRAREVSPMAGIERALDLHDEPGHAAMNQYWIHSLLETARSREIGTLLTGQGGNATVSWSGLQPARLLPYLKRRQWRALATEFGAVRREAGAGLWVTLRSQLLGPLVPSWRRRYRRWRAGRHPWIEYSAINRALGRSLDLPRLMARRGHDPAFLPPEDPRESQCALIMPGRSIVGALWLENGAGYGLEVRDPTFDKRLMSFCVSVPNSQVARNGQDRLMLRRGLDGLLPPEVLWNRRLGLQAVDIGQRVLEHRGEMEAVLDRLESSDLAQQYLDLPRMGRIYRALQQRIDREVTVQAQDLLLRGVMAGLFLLRFETESPPRPPPAPAV